MSLTKRRYLLIGFVYACQRIVGIPSSTTPRHYSKISRVYDTVQAAWCSRSGPLSLRLMSMAKTRRDIPCTCKTRLRLKAGRSSSPSKRTTRDVKGGKPDRKVSSEARNPAFTPSCRMWKEWSLDSCADANSVSAATGIQLDSRVKCLNALRSMKNHIRHHRLGH